MGTTASRDHSSVVDDQESRVRALELVRTLEANGLTLLAEAVARRSLPSSCEVVVLEQWRCAPGRRGGHGARGTVATTPHEALGP